VAGTWLPYFKLNSAALAPVENAMEGAATVAAADFIKARRVSCTKFLHPFRPWTAALSLSFRIAEHLYLLYGTVAQAYPVCQVGKTS
jgi:hypothetical protein